MKDLIERSYEAIKARGLIINETPKYEFLRKIDEEHREVHLSITQDEYIEELIDLATVCFMQIRHLNCDVIKEFEKVVIKNEQRANENK